MGIMIVAGTMIGSGIFLLPATLATVGTISLFGWLIASAGALLIGLTLVFLCTVSDRGFLDAIGKALGPFAGQAAALLYFLSFPLVLAAIAIAAGGNIGFLFPSLKAQPAATLLAMLFVALLAILVQLGARQLARFVSAALLIGLLPILLVATLGWTQFDPQTFRDGWNRTDGPPSTALFQASLLCFWAFLGLESASVISRRMRDPQHSVPIATVGGILLASLVYISATTAISGIVPVADLARSTAPFADATALFLGPVAAVIVAIAAATKALGTLGSSQLSGAESWLAFQRQLGIGGLSFGVANATLAALAMLVVWFTASPTLASQYGQIIGAVVVLSLLVFSLAGLAVVRVCRGVRRAAGLGTMVFALGLIAAQPASTLLLAAITGATVALPLALLRLARRPIAG
jgi:arginine:agmatine antiporter